MSVIRRQLINSAPSRTSGKESLPLFITQLLNFLNATTLKRRKFKLHTCSYRRFGGTLLSSRTDSISSRTFLYCSSIDSSSSIGTTAHCGLRPVEQYPSMFSYPSPTLSIFSLPALEDLFLLPLPILSWAFPFFLSLPVLG